MPNRWHFCFIFFMISIIDRSEHEFLIIYSKLVSHSTVFLSNVYSTILWRYYGHISFKITVKKLLSIKTVEWLNNLLQSLNSVRGMEFHYILITPCYMLVLDFSTSFSTSNTSAVFWLIFLIAIYRIFWYGISPNLICNTFIIDYVDRVLVLFIQHGELLCCVIHEVCDSYGQPKMGWIFININMYDIYEKLFWFNLTLFI